MKYSIITINYNNRDGLERTIQSVINQTCQDFEYIIIDGGSTDGSVDVIKKYADRIDYWVSEPDKGIYNAMNKGILQAHGEYLNFMNSGDCFYNDEVLGAVNNNFLDDSNVVIYGDSYELLNDSNLIYRKSFPFWENTTDYIYSKGFCHQSSFIKCSYAKKYGFDEKYKISADYNLFYILYKQALTFTYIPIIISIFETDGLSIRNKKKAYKEDAIVINRYGTLYYYYNFIIKFYYYRIEWWIKNKFKLK